MATLNKVMLIGRLTRDPEATATPTGVRIIKFGFAVGRSRKNPQTGQWENDPNPLFIDSMLALLETAGFEENELLHAYNVVIAAIS